jgi:hypothetical protein
MLSKILAEQHRRVILYRFAPIKPKSANRAACFRSDLLLFALAGIDQSLER